MGDAAVGREVVQAAGVVAEPDVVAAAGDREHVVSAHLRMVGLAVVAEAAAGPFEHAQAAVLRSHPDPVARADDDELDLVAGHRPPAAPPVPPPAPRPAAATGQPDAGDAHRYNAT